MPALSACMNSLHYCLLAGWLFAAGSGAAVAGAALTDPSVVLVMAAVVLLGASMAVFFAMQRGLDAALELIDGFALELAAGRLFSRLDTRRCAALAPLAERLNGMARFLSGLFLAFARMSPEIFSTAGLNVARSIERVAPLADTNEHLVRENSELSRYLSELSVQLTGALKKYQYE